MDHSDFQVGDRVRVRAIELPPAYSESPITPGMVGTVVMADKFNVGISFDKDIGSHDCRGRCEWGHGWFMSREYTGMLEIVQDIDKWIAAGAIADDSQLLAFLKEGWL